MHRLCLVLLVSSVLGGCGAHNAKARSGRAHLLERAETRAANQVGCVPADVHASWQDDGRVAVNACGTMLEYRVVPSSCSDDLFLRNATAAAVDGCRLEAL